jgi:hypothetical protein
VATLKRLAAVLALGVMLIAATMGLAQEKPKAYTLVVSGAR